MKTVCSFFRPLLVLMLVAAASIPARAQLYLGVRGGATLPTGFYAESRMSENEWMLIGGHQKKAGAGIGFSAGLEAAFAMPFHTNLEVVLSADYMQSGPSRDVRDYYLTYLTQRYGAAGNFTCTLPYFRNIPALLGIRYAYPTGKLIDLYAEALCGVNYRMISPFSHTADARNYTSTSGQYYQRYYNHTDYTYANTLTFAFRLGGGIIINDMFTLGASFSMLGGGRLSWDNNSAKEYLFDGGANQKFEDSEHKDYYEINPTMVTVSLGFRFPVWKGASRVQDF